MKPTITTNVEVTVKKDSRSLEIISKGIVEIEISEISRNLQNDSRTLKVQDYLVVDFPEPIIDLEGNIIEKSTVSRQRIAQKNSKYHKDFIIPKEDFEQLELYFTTNYPNATFNQMVAFALLDETQTNPIYEQINGEKTLPFHWEIKTN